MIQLKSVIVPGKILWKFDEAFWVPFVGAPTGYNTATARLCWRLHFSMDFFKVASDNVPRGTSVAATRAHCQILQCCSSEA
ncbi:unnamed protein product [Cercopithifilaria johnstoni]|uniref:Uncharacterized protein n=1 Tax=Cercopithifilaria johnstoni TaxID=2874296 RepID=A0A8J2M2J4_9BILA|nr:unnamed protein product [Cercopithifilaria johnstoni]